MVKTGTQEFRRFIGKALAKVEEMHAQGTKVLLDNVIKEKVSVTVYFSLHREHIFDSL